MSGSPQGGDARRDAGEGIGAGRTGQAHGRGGGVLLVVGVQDEDAVHGLGQDGVALVVLSRHGEAHAQEVLGVAQLVARAHERLADGVFIGARGDRRDLGDHAVHGDPAVVRIIDVQGVVIEGRQGADRGGHDGHGVGVAPETLEKPVELILCSMVCWRDVPFELGVLGRGRQFAVHQQIADLQEGRLLGQLVDGIAAVQEHALVAIDVGDGALASNCGGGEAGIEGEAIGLGVQLAHVDDVGPDRSLENGKVGKGLVSPIVSEARAGCLSSYPFPRASPGCPNRLSATNAAMRYNALMAGEKSIVTPPETLVSSQRSQGARQVRGAG